MNDELPICQRCELRPATGRGRDAGAETGEIALCAECWELVRGRVAYDVMRVAGSDDVDDIFGDDPGDAEFRAFGRSLQALWGDAPPELLEEMEANESADDLRAFAEYLAEVGETQEKPPSPAVRRFLDRHLGGGGTGFAEGPRG